LGFGGAYKIITEKNGVPVSLEKAYNEGHVNISLKGRRLNGGYALIKMKRKRQWLLIKSDDFHADRSNDITEKYTSSVKSDKTLEDLEKE